MTELGRIFAGDDLGRAEDRFDPFCKYVFRLIDRQGFEALAQQQKGNVNGAVVLQGLGLVTETEIKANKAWDWRETTLPSTGSPCSPFLEHLLRTLKFRNKDDHNAPLLGKYEKALAVRSFCTSLVWTVIKFTPQIQAALHSFRFAAYLVRIRDKFAAIGGTKWFVPASPTRTMGAAGRKAGAVLSGVTNCVSGFETHQSSPRAGHNALVVDRQDLRC